MSFYLNMLREEDEMLGNTGFDPDMVATPDDEYSIELKDIAQAVEDINTDYADQSSQKELDGQDLQEDPVSECMIAMYESEHNWNSIMQAIGQREVLEAARGREMVMEAVDIKGFFNKVKNFFVKMWKKFTAIVKNWIDNAMAAFRTNKSFAAKYGSKLADGKKAYESDSSKKQFKGYNFFSDGSVKDFTAAIEGIVKSAKNDNDAGAKWAREFSAKVDAKTDFIRELNSGSVSFVVLEPDKFRGRLCNKNSIISSSEFRDALKESYFGSKEKVTLSGKSIDPKEIVSILNSGAKDVEGIKKAYKECKKAFDSTIKALKGLEKALDKIDASKDKSNAMSHVTKYISNEKECKNALTMSSSMLMKAIHAQKSQARKVANAYIFALNKGTRKDKIEKADKIGESGFFSNLEMI